MSNEFKDKRRVWWISGVALLVLGTLAALIVLPARAPDVPAGPKVHVPAMQNIPSNLSSDRVLTAAKRPRQKAPARRPMGWATP